MERGQDAHRHFEQLAVAHVLGGLDESDARVFRSHLLECETCRARVGELRALAHDLADVERHERRARAAKAVETKQRSAGERPEPAPHRSPRAGRLALVAGLLVLIGMTGWNFMLRQTVAQQQLDFAQLRSAATLLDLGQPATLEAVAEEVRADVRFDADDIVVAAQGLEQGKVYAIYLADENGRVLVGPRTVVTEDDRLLQLLPRSPGTVTVSVTQPDPERPVPDDSAEGGRPILQAVLPLPSRTATRVPELSDTGS